jgi:hypothetical protein
MNARESTERGEANPSSSTSPTPTGAALEPCPFCGSGLEVVCENGAIQNYIHPDTECFIGLRVIWPDTIAAWNCRAPISPAALGEGEVELAKLLEKAGDERWAVDPDYRIGMDYNNHIIIEDYPDKRIAFMAHAGMGRQDEFDAKAALIVAMRNHLPSLLTALTDMREERERLREALEELFIAADLTAHSFNIGVMDEAIGKARAALSQAQERRGKGE